MHSKFCTFSQKKTELYETEVLYDSLFTFRFTDRSLFYYSDSRYFHKNIVCWLDAIFDLDLVIRLTNRNHHVNNNI